MLEQVTLAPWASVSSPVNCLQVMRLNFHSKWPTQYPLKTTHSAPNTRKWQGIQGEQKGTAEVPDGKGGGPHPPMGGWDPCSSTSHMMSKTRALKPPCPDAHERTAQTRWSHNHFMGFPQTPQLEEFYIWGNREKQQSKRGLTLLSIHPEKSIAARDTCTPMFTAALFARSRTRKQPRHPSTEEWTKM